MMLSPTEQALIDIARALERIASALSRSAQADDDKTNPALESNWRKR